MDTSELLKEKKERNPVQKIFWDLLQTWSRFASVLFNPVAFILLLASVTLLLYSTTQTDPKIISILTIVISVVTGFLGGVYAKKWDDISGEKVIVTRGKSATRSLQHLLDSSINLEKRVRLYLQRFVENKDAKITNEVIKTYFEEIIGKCSNVEHEVVNSIEDWKDIVPSADIRPIINIFSELQEKYETATAELIEVNDQLMKLKESSDERYTKLLEEKEILQSNLKQAKENLKQEALISGYPSLSGSALTNPNFFTYGHESKHLMLRSSPGQTYDLDGVTVTMDQNDATLPLEAPTGPPKK